MYFARLFDWKPGFAVLLVTIALWPLAAGLYFLWGAAA